MNAHRSGRRMVLAAAAWAAVAVFPARPAAAGERPPDAALESARRFANAILHDDQDRAKALQQVADAYIQRGDPDRAASLFGAFDHWRAICVMADVAGEYAALGADERARVLLTEAARRARDVRGWPRDRVQMHLAMGLAMLGEEEVVAATQTRYETLRDYRGPARAARAVALARAGRMDEARRVLDEISDDVFYDTRVWRVRGYLRLADPKRLADARMPALLDEAWAAAAVVPDHQRPELQLEIADAWIAAGDSKKARERLEETTAALTAPNPNTHLIAPVLPRVAAVWGRLGDRERVAAIERYAEPIIADLQSIERPELWALWGEAWQAAGDEAAARERFARAIAAAGELKNPRPRALAGVAIALAWARTGLADEETAARLRRLEETFAP